MKIRSVGDEFFHAERRTDITKLIASFANAPKNKSLCETIEDNPYISIRAIRWPDSFALMKANVLFAQTSINLYSSSHRSPCSLFKATLTFVTLYIFIKKEQPKTHSGPKVS